MKKDLIRLASILSALLLFFITADAQTTTNYNLSAFKLPDYRYRQLVTEFNLAGANNSNKTGDLKYLDNYMKGDVNAKYYSYLNSRKTQRSQYFSVNFYGNSSNKENLHGITDNSSLYSSLFYQLYNKRYFQNKIFIATGAYAGYSYGHINNSYESNDTLITILDNSTNEHEVRVNIPLGIGIGRIEQVQDFQKAIYIYEDLLKSGRAVAGKSEQEVMELATLISQLKNKRYFDFRIRNIQDIETLDSFLIANNFKTQSDARYFATLVDNWNFVNNFLRESGTAITLKATPRYDYHQNFSVNNQDDFTNKYIRGSYGIEGGLVFEHFKPLNLYWQSNTLVSAGVGYSGNIYEESDTIVHSDYSSSHPTINMHLTQEVEYYPNTRTRMTASLIAGYNKTFEEKDLDTEESLSPARDYIYSGISLKIEYYISQRLRLNASSSVSYINENIATVLPQKRTGFNSTFKANLAYSIF